MAALSVPLACFAFPMAGCSSNPGTTGNDASTGSDVTTSTTGSETGTTTGKLDGATTGSTDAGALCTGCKVVPLTATNTGYVDYTGYPMANTVHVIGAWYAYGDGWGTEQVDGGVGVAGERGDCELKGGFPPSLCSSITSPLPAAPPVDAGPDAGAPTTAPAGYDNGFTPTPADSQTFCLTGVAAGVPTPDGGTTPDYSDVYGIGVGFDFNNVGGVKSAYNAPAYKVVGVQFTLSSKGAWPSPRVEFPTTDTLANGMDSYDISPAAAGTYTVYWTPTLEMPYPPVVGTNVSYMWPGDAQPMFKPADLLSIQVHVPTVPMVPTTVDGLCITGLSAIVSP
jgi:hypothetical protein